MAKIVRIQRFNVILWFLLQRHSATSFSTATRQRQGWSRPRDIRILIHRGRTVRTSSRGGGRNESNWYSTISTCIIPRTRPTSECPCLSPPLSLSLFLSVFPLACGYMLRIDSVERGREGGEKMFVNVSARDRSLNRISSGKQG